MKLLIVESPSKAKTIRQYLGRSYNVLASFGHVRDLVAKNGAVDPDNDFAMQWEVSQGSQKHLSEIKQALKGADGLVLATDPDREGEAISWHLLEYLTKARALKASTSVERVTFNAITKDTVRKAVAEPRSINTSLVDAYMARRSLDYLVGFNLSPVLWRKLPGAKSAGRVQSVALRLVTDREAEIEVFEKREYWSVFGTVDIGKDGKRSLVMRLIEADGKKLDKFAVGSQEQAEALQSGLRGCGGDITSVTERPEKRSPAPPFTTSTLQQEASRKLNLSAKETMAIAQRLYEGVQMGGELVGLITYMRTDSVTLSSEAVSACRSYAEQTFGADYVPAKSRGYKSKARLTQEAHEAIRPSDIYKTPEKVAGVLRGKDLALYRLIWNRTLACQLADARFLRTTIRAEVKSPEHSYALSATGAVQEFDGFLRVYQEGVDDPAKDSEDTGSEGDNAESRALPRVRQGEASHVSEARGDQHFTQPPPRFTEASLIREMEKIGIGRPSTYTSTLSVLQDRSYVRVENKRLIPEARGRLVTAFLMRYFPRYVDHDFTANLESKLDQIADGEVPWVDVMREFWSAFHVAVKDMDAHNIGDVLDAISPMLERYLFPPREGGQPADGCPACENGKLSLRLGKFGAFLGCDQYPTCRFVRSLDGDAAQQDTAMVGPTELGIRAETGNKIVLKSGRFGPYLEEVPTEVPEEGTKKAKAPPPHRSGLPAGVSPENVTLELAQALLSLPRVVGTYPETEEVITAALGRYGPYLRCGKTSVTLDDWRDLFEIQDNRAISLIKDRKSSGGRGRGAQALRSLGEDPKSGDTVEVFSGRFGPYVKARGVNATIPSTLDPQAITLEEAVTLIDAREAKGTTKKPTRRTAQRKTAAKSTGTKSAATKKKATSTKASASTKAKSTATKTTRKATVKKT